MKKAAILLAGVALVVALYAGVRYRSAKATSTAPPVPLMKDMDGGTLDVSSYAGKVVVINFWAAWCTPCRDEIPQFIELQNRQRERGLQIVGISMDDTMPALRKFHEETKMNYPVVIGNQQLAEAYGGVLGLPTTVLIGRDQRVRDKLVGTTEFKVLEEKIEKLLEEK